MNLQSVPFFVLLTTYFSPRGVKLRFVRQQATAVGGGNRNFIFTSNESRRYSSLNSRVLSYQGCERASFVLGSNYVQESVLCCFQSLYGYRRGATAGNIDKKRCSFGHWN